MTTPLWKRVIVYILEGLLALVFISPLIWVVVCSFSPQPGSAQSKGWGVNNYLTLFGYQEGLPKYLFNSVVVTLVAVVFSVVVCTLAGYSFSRFDYPGRNLGFMVTLSILMVPYASLLIPLMVWYKDIGLNDSLLGVGLVITLFQLPMSTFIMRNAFDAIPKDMEEAAMVDGASKFQRIRHIDIPAIVPTMSITLILAVGGLMSVGHEKVYLMQNPTNISVSEIISTYSYKAGLISGQYSYSSAIGMFNSVVNFILLLVANVASKKFSGSGIL